MAVDGYERALAVVQHFDIDGNVVSVETFGEGHIHSTYRIHTSGNNTTDLLLQKINTHVFRDVDGLMSNIDLVTKHMRDRLIRAGYTDVERRSLLLIKTSSGKPYAQDVDTSCWRMYNFIPEHRVFDRISDHQIAYEGARMFGDFIYQLSDVDPSLLVETIPDFHNLAYRMRNLEKAISEDVENRLVHVRDEIKYTRNSFEVMNVIHALGEKGIIQPRIVHNDTKINNVLFDKDNKGLCVIDLDTVMPGYIAYDFGDGIRTGANVVDEDEEDLSLIGYDLSIFEAFATGFIDALEDLPGNEELESLPHAALLFPFIMGVRFLTDYLQGDIYYKIKHPTHNLVRARAQLRLAQDGESKLSEMQKIVTRISSAS